MNVLGGVEPRAGMAPAQQRLEADDLAGDPRLAADRNMAKLATLDRPNSEHAAARAARAGACPSPASKKRVTPRPSAFAR